jgi:signal transduction histidine kinase
VLVVDDNEPNRILAEETLRSDGYDVVLAVTGEEALSAFERERPDLVLLDVRMPGLDGFATCARLRGLPGGQETPVVFLTAQRDVDTYDRALRSGADDFLTKPMRPVELLARVQTLLRIRRLSDELNDHFGIVRKQRDDLVRLQLQKEQLMAFVVHDLKNHVNSIALHASLLVREPKLSEDGRESADAIKDEARNLTRLVLNLLDISKGDEGQLRPRMKEVELRGLLEKVASAGQARARSRGQQIEVSSELSALAVHADEDLLSRVLDNLLDNALRHSPQRGTITLGLDAAGEEAVLLRVADTGPGIPEALRERIFEKYVQVEQGPADVTRAGRGLGLAFCRLAIEAHGGTIGVDAAARGTVFWVRLPRGS